ncbi:MAG: phosphoglycolate phosphatase [Thiohalospira sp.]
MQPRLIICDLDGTLVDSVPDLARCVDSMLAALGREPAGESKVRDWVGNGVERLVRRALVGQMDGEPDESDFWRAYPIFLECYAEHASHASRCYPGVEEGLEALAARGLPLACITNKAERFTLPLLRDLGLTDHFGLVVAGDTLVRSKPDPLPLLHVAAHYGVEPDAVLMVGDSVSDVKAARAAGAAVVCMSYGYNHGRDIREMGSDAVLDRLDELPALLDAGLPVAS